MKKYKCTALKNNDWLVLFSSPSCDTGKRNDRSGLLCGVAILQRSAAGRKVKALLKGQKFRKCVTPVGSGKIRQPPVVVLHRVTHAEI
jgi:hypothetical protein